MTSFVGGRSVFWFAFAGLMIATVAGCVGEFDSGAANATAFVDGGMPTEALVSDAMVLHRDANEEARDADAALVDGGVISEAPKAPTNPVVVMTDIHGSEPDDAQSFIRLLVHANEFNLKGIILTTAAGASARHRLYPELLESVIARYADVNAYEKLSQHAPGFYTPNALRALIHQGVVAASPRWGMAAAMASSSNDGAAHLIRVVEDADEEVWVMAWGGTNTLAKALLDYRATHGAEAAKVFANKIRVFEIHRQDDAGAWIVKNFPEIHWIRSDKTWRGISPRLDGHFSEARGGDESLVSEQWYSEHIRSRCGAFGAEFPRTKYLAEGDTPSMLYFFNNGLGDPAHPNFGSWGGRYEPALLAPLDCLDRSCYQKEYRIDGKMSPALDERPFVEDGKIAMVSDADDTWREGRGRNSPYENNRYATLFRWRRAFQHEFAARMSWCDLAFAEANHPPILRLVGTPERQGRSGDIMNIDLSPSSDPDGDRLAATWFVYSELSDSSGVEMVDTNGLNATIRLPNVESASRVHLIAEVEDDGIPSLTRYRRIIIHISP